MHLEATTCLLPLVFSGVVPLHVNSCLPCSVCEFPPLIYRFSLVIDTGVFINVPLDENFESECQQAVVILSWELYTEEKKWPQPFQSVHVTSVLSRLHILLSWDTPVSLLTLISVLENKNSCLLMCLVSINCNYIYLCTHTYIRDHKGWVDFFLKHFLALLFEVLLTHWWQIINEIFSCYS